MLNIKLGIAAVIVASAISAGITYGVMADKVEVARLEKELVISNLNTETERLKKELVRIESDFSKRLNDERNTLDAEYETKVADLNRSVGQLANVRLRDPNRSQNRPSAPSPDSPGTCSCDGPDSGELSGPTSQFLLGLAAEADGTRERLRICQQWVARIEQENQTQIDSINQLNEETPD